jgi:hypothetical protein
MNNPLWKRGEYCIAKYTDNQFYRGRIIEVPIGKTVIYARLQRNTVRYLNRLDLVLSFHNIRFDMYLEKDVR